MEECWKMQNCAEAVDDTDAGCASRTGNDEKENLNPQPSTLKTPMNSRCSRARAYASWHSGHEPNAITAAGWSFVMRGFHSSAMVATYLGPPTGGTSASRARYRLARPGTATGREQASVAESPAEAWQQRQQRSRRGTLIYRRRAVANAVLPSCPLLDVRAPTNFTQRRTRVVRLGRAAASCPPVLEHVRSGGRTRARVTEL
eukprot:354704-Chlamydomonas_euryale.AAC.3